MPVTSLESLVPQKSSLTSVLSGKSIITSVIPDDETNVNITFFYLHTSDSHSGEDRVLEDLNRGHL